jgi:hypothetical protein
MNDALLPIGVLTYFYYPEAPLTDIAERARAFEAAPIGTHGLRRSSLMILLERV